MSKNERCTHYWCLGAIVLGACGNLVGQDAMREDSKLVPVGLSGLKGWRRRRGVGLWNVRVQWSIRGIYGYACVRGKRLTSGCYYQQKLSWEKCRVFPALQKRRSPFNTSGTLYFSYFIFIFFFLPLPFVRLGLEYVPLILPTL